MKKAAFVVVAIGAVVFIRAAMLAAPAQTTARPGDMTRANVWIANRQKTEAVPVTLYGLDVDARPLRVEIPGTPAVTITPNTIVQAKVVRQPWDHRMVTVPAGQDVAIALRDSGNAGWEAVSAQVAPSGATIVMLKRPLQ